MHGPFLLTWSTIRVNLFRKKIREVKLFLIVPGILSLIAVLKVMFSSQDMNTSSPWSRDVTFAGSIAAFAASFLYVFAISQSCMRYIQEKKIKRQSGYLSNSQFSREECSDTSQRQNIQVIPLDNFPSAASGSHLNRQNTNFDEDRSVISMKYSLNPPAYSEIYG